MSEKNEYPPVGSEITGNTESMAENYNQGSTSDPAILGGSPVRNTPWPAWPEWNQATDEELIMKVMRSGVWSRAGVVEEFEKEWAKLIGSKRCLGVVNGTNALITSLIQLGIGAGDEVIIPPYTFIASVQSIFQAGAIPVFVDVDPETFQIDPDKIEARITSRTRAIMPVHILGLPADMNRIMAIAKKHKLLVVEDACQSWLAEINGKKVGTFGNAGCFSFQNSKNIPMGEGGAIVSDDDEFMDRCYSYHNYGNPFGSAVGEVGSGTVIPGNKLRLTEYQAAIGLAQMARLQEQTTTRNNNADYLKSRIKDIPGILPYVFIPGVTRAAFHLFPFRYKKEQFSGLSREVFLKALQAEGIPCSGGYTPVNRMPYIENIFKSKNFKLMYSEDLLDYNKYMERTNCPLNDQLCREAVWFGQNMLIGDKKDMDDIANAIEKISSNASRIKEKTDKAV